MDRVSRRRFVQSATALAGAGVLATRGWRALAHCCTGTGAEEYAKLGDTLYFHDDSGIYVNQFAASEVAWPEKGVRLTQHTEFPEIASTTLTVEAAKPVQFALRVRAPYWSSGMAITVNGKPVKTSVVNGYVAVERTWQSGDRVEASLPMHFHAAPLPGNAKLEAMMYGPLVLAGLMGKDGLTTEMIYGREGPSYTGKFTDATMPRIETGKAGVWVEKADGPLRFKTAGQAGAMALKPLHQVMDERYTIYFEMDRKA